MHKLTFFLLCSFVLSGCSQTQRAQQYFGQNFTSVLNPVSHINSQQPRDYSTFAKQAEQVTVNSPTMAERYASLYNRLNEWVLESGDPALLSQYGIQAAQLGGSDNHGNVLFTGYFSPVMELRHKKEGKFQYPVYAYPGCGDNCPTRSEIYQGALDGQHLELGYAANMIDPFIMEVQGSGFVHFADDDSFQYFAYAGKNNKPYVSIGKVLIDQNEVPREKMSLKAIKDWVMNNDPERVKSLLEQNPSFVFFSPSDDIAVKGSAGIPLLPMAAVAADRSLFPMGTPLLAEVPLLKPDGTWSGTHVLRLLIALDTGGAVKQNHIDLYHGMGARAGVDAGHYKHFGRVWKLGLTGTVTALPWLTTDGNQSRNSTNSSDSHPSSADQ